MADLKDDIANLRAKETNFRNRVSSDLTKRRLAEALEKSSDEDAMQKIVDQLLHCGFDDATVSLGELEGLVQVLKDDETILMATSGVYTKNDHYVLLVVSNQRIFALSNRELLGLQTFNIPFDVLTKVVVHYGVVTSIIRLDTDASAYRFMNISNDDILRLTYVIGLNVDQDTVPLVEKEKNLLNFDNH